MRASTHRAFTIVELLVVVSIIALLVGILLPAIGKAREQSKVTMSQANLRNLGAAHQAYAAAWSDRQLTLVDDNMSTYGGTTPSAFLQYIFAHGGPGDDAMNDPSQHPPVYLGYGWHPTEQRYRMMAYRTHNFANAELTQPIIFESGNGEYFGSFRLPNALQFSEYVSGRFYDPVFYSPKDEIVIDSIGPCFDSPDEFCLYADTSTEMGVIPAWSSYCMSPAAMFNPEVMRHDDPEVAGDGWQNPWSLPAGFRSPAFSQTLYPNLKTHMLEHHWLQNPPGTGCNSAFDGGTYAECEPYYFNHSWESTPVTLFYDGHVEMVGVRDTMRADGRVRAQTGSPDWGLWSKDCAAWGTDGYLIETGYDQAATSFHILTTDGIRGRDVLGN